MKKLIFILPILFSFYSFGQIIVKSDSTVFRLCNAVEVTTNLSNEELYIICGNMLIDNGLIIDNASKDFFTMITKSISGNMTRQCSISITIKNHSVKIRGFLTSAESNYIPKVKYPNGNFDYLQNLGNQLSEKTKGKITYLQEKYEFLD